MNLGRLGFEISFTGIMSNEVQPAGSTGEEQLWDAMIVLGNEHSQKGIKSIPLAYSACSAWDWDAFNRRDAKSRESERFKAMEEKLLSHGWKCGSISDESKNHKTYRFFAKQMNFMNFMIVDVRVDSQGQIVVMTPEATKMEKNVRSHFELIQEDIEVCIAMHVQDCRDREHVSVLQKAKKVVQGIKDMCVAVVSRLFLNRQALDSARHQA